MTFTRVGTATAVRKTSGQTSASFTTTAAGNLFVVAVQTESASLASTTLSAANVTGFAMAGTAHSNSGGANTLLWWGVTNAASTVTATLGFSGTPGSTGVEASYTEYHSSVAGVWSLVNTLTTVLATTSTTISWAALSASTGTQLYVGKEYDTGSTTTAGSTSGCTYVSDSAGYIWVYDLALTGSVTPTCTVSPAASYNAMGAVFANTLVGMTADNFFPFFE